MKIEQAHIARIRTAFEKMRSKEDLLHIMNEAKILVYGDKAVPFQLKQLTWYANPKLGRTRYVEFKIKKKSGTDRSINAPVAGLKAIQRTLAFILQCVFEPHKSAMGFVKKRSIVDNAKIHAGAKYVYNIDLKDFFSSIDQARVWKCFQLPPFNLETSHESKPAKTMKYNSGKHVYYTQKENFRIDYEIITPNKIIIFKTGDYDKFKEKISKEPFFEEKINSNIDWKKNSLPALIELVLQSAIKKNVINAKDADPNDASITSIKANGTQSLANMLASICCTALDVERKNSDGDWITIRKNVLPQGAPTSPVITNIICQKLDHRLSGVAKRFGLKYSRYADDITFSSMHNVYQPESEFLKELHRIIEEQNFHIKESKTRLQKDGYRKEVTGLLVNEKANVQKRYIKQLRMWLYYWERYGYEKASGLFLQQYISDKGHVKSGKHDIAKVIAGKLDYLKMVKGADNELYLKLKSRFDALISSDVSSDITIKKVDKTSTLSSLEALSSIPNLVTDPDLIDELLDEYYGNQVNFNDDSLMNEPKIIYNNSEKNNLNICVEVNSKEKTIIQNKKENSSIPIIHKPKELVALLKNFSVNDSALKYTTHSWDAGRDANMFKDLSEFLSIAKSQYSEFSYALKRLSENLNGKIYNFLFNKEIAKSGWGDINPKKRIYFGWSSPELLEACKNDISLNPEDFILPEKFQFQRAGKTLQKFKHIIDVFKNEIEVRDENSALLNLILQKHDNYLISFSAPKVSNLENKTFYTDMQWLGKALDLIFEGIQKYPQHPVVEYTVTENNNDKLVLTILHRNSFKNGLSIYDDKLNLKRGDFSTLKDKLRNLCDWCIESEFAEGAYRINYLVSDNQNPAYEKILSAEGFKHVLTFYK